MTIEYQIITDEAAFLALEPKWDALHAASTERRFSQSFAWCRTTWEQVERPLGRRLFCLVARDEGRVVLIWPSVIMRSALWLTALPLGGAYAEYMYVLVADDGNADQRVSEAWKALRRACKCDIIHISCVREGSVLHRMMESEKSAKPVGFESTSSVEWALSGDWESYYQTLRADDRREITRRQRRIGQLGKVGFEAVKGGPRCVAIIDWVLRHKVEQLRRAGKRGPWLETEAYRNLLTVGATRGGASGSMLGFALTLDSQIIAARITRVDSRRIESLTTVFDPAYGKYGPGQILTFECLKWAWDQHLDFDMRVGEYAWKHNWANATCKIVSYDVLNTSWGRFYRLVRSARHHFLQSVFRLPAPIKSGLKILLGRRPSEAMVRRQSSKPSTLA